MIDRDFWRGCRVLLTGHTGFKGSWLAVWLLDLKAALSGFSLVPDTNPSLFDLSELGRRMNSTIGDIRDKTSVQRIFAEVQPEVVFHLAAQSLVRRSYREPLETLATNIMGTAHVLEAARTTQSVRALVLVTSDKCYENDESLRGYREGDRVGGRDPYSASKSCAEIVAGAYSCSFFNMGFPALATARAGNVVGGGDWAADRLVPDMVQSLRLGNTPIVRNPRSIRPWQHVLEPLAGYLMLGERLYRQGQKWSGPWNFGPRGEDTRTVKEVADLVVNNWGSGYWREAALAGDNQPHEASYLRLNCEKANTLLGWEPQWRLEEAIRLTVEWYRKVLLDGRDAFATARSQIHDFERISQIGSQ
jgi:CDP-glucose 4,6-dehydratase